MSYKTKCGIGDCSSWIIGEDTSEHAMDYLSHIKMFHKRTYNELVKTGTYTDWDTYKELPLPAWFLESAQV